MFLYLLEDGSNLHKIGSSANNACYLHSAMNTPEIFRIYFRSYFPIYTEMTVGDINAIQKGLYHKVGVPARENGGRGWRRAVFVLSLCIRGVWGDGALEHWGVGGYIPGDVCHYLMCHLCFVAVCQYDARCLSSLGLWGI